MGINVSINFIIVFVDCKDILVIRLLFLVMIIKNMKKYFLFEV